MHLLPPFRRFMKIFHPEGIPAPGTKFYNLISSTKIFQHHYELIAKDILSFSSEGSILDIGTGPGWLLLKMHEISPELKLTGVDISPSMVAKARSNIAAAGFSQKIEILKADAVRLPFDDDSFDIVASTGSIHHWKNPVAGLNEVYRVLKPGCHALMYDLATDTPSSILNDSAHKFGRLRMLIFWLHSFEEPFYSQKSFEEMSRATLFKQGTTRFAGLLCCLILYKQ